MRINYLIFSVFSALLLGLNGPAYANITESSAYSTDLKGESTNRFRKFLGNLNRLEFKLPRISRKRASDKYSLDDLVSRLQEVENTRNNTKNPFKKIRCLIQESNIKRKISSLLKQREEEEKLEKLEEEFSIDYSPKALSEEGSVPHYVPVVVDSYKEVAITPEISVKGDEEGEVGDKFLASEGADESTTGELVELPQQITSEVDVENEGTGDSVTQELEKKDAEDSLEDYQAKDLDSQSQSELGDQQTTSLQENIDTQKKDQNQNSRANPLLKLLKKKKLTVSEELEKLMSLKKAIEGKISSSKSLVSRKFLGMKLKRVNNKISKITESAVDAVTESGEMDIE
ncbi:uncharacterized protein ELE39_001752 [Cryptosporidium sp. chipmunk genotype I]|uniref:uncharacterized protein n=1 Tax=Cryptosporidium sp. chipmunk genotype I TaxID=1280935 RepID=UPI00351A2F2E|nr:hypothetical protein ELE39_001752 [Cryptosporidium sp. chipmunk genotype I]